MWMSRIESAEDLDVDGVDAETADVEGAGDGGGEAGGLGPGLNSCGEEELQASVTKSYLRRGLVEQRGSVPVPRSRERPEQLGDLGLAGSAYLDGVELVPGDQQVGVAQGLARGQLLRPKEEARPVPARTQDRLENRREVGGRRSAVPRDKTRVGTCAAVRQNSCRLTRGLVRPVQRGTRGLPDVCQAGVRK